MNSNGNNVTMVPIPISKYKCTTMGLRIYGFMSLIAIILIFSYLFILKDEPSSGLSAISLGLGTGFLTSTYVAFLVDCSATRRSNQLISEMRKHELRSVFAFIAHFYVRIAVFSECIETQVQGESYTRAPNQRRSIKEWLNTSRNWIRKASSECKETCFRTGEKQIKRILQSIIDDISKIEEKGLSMRAGEYLKKEELFALQSIKVYAEKCLENQFDYMLSSKEGVEGIIGQVDCFEDFSAINSEKFGCAGMMLL